MKTFWLYSDIELYGGFTGSERLLAERGDPASHETILSGDLDGNDLAGFGNYGDNAQRVVTADSVTGSRLDGVTVRAGSSDSIDYGGGGLYVISSSELTLSGRVVEVNEATHGGGLYTELDSQVTIEDTLFDGNRGVGNSSQGGAIYALDFAHVMVTNSEFTNNQAGFGGAVYVTECGELTLDGATFQGNSAVNGGAIGSTNPKALSALRSDFIENDADSGGGAFSGNGAPRFEGCTFKDNSSGGDGGALAMNSGTLRLFRSLLQNNTALTGGAVSCVAGDFANTQFIGNTSTGGAPGGNGGAIAARGRLRIANGVFTANVAAGSGGGLYLVDDPAGSSIADTVFQDNEGLPGSAPYIASANSLANADIPTVGNSIFWGNTGPYGNAIRGDVTVKARHTAFENTCEDLDVDCDTGNLQGEDPLFVDQANGDFHLQSTSPLINAGSASDGGGDFADLDGDGNTSEPLPSDLDDADRAQGSAVDIGPYESE